MVEGLISNWLVLRGEVGYKVGQVDPVRVSVRQSNGMVRGNSRLFQTGGHFIPLTLECPGDQCITLHVTNRIVSHSRVVYHQYHFCQQ